MKQTSSLQKFRKVQKSTEKIKDENQTLKKQLEIIQDPTKTDIVPKIRELQIGILLFLCTIELIS